MNNNQCEQVVEEIWGWGYKEHEHREIVNSWEGFGLTVEAMTGKGLTDNQLICYRFACVDIIDIGTNKTKEEFWERVHLAALEAIK